MRILHIDTETGFRGGQRQVQLLLRGLQSRGHDSLLIAPQEAPLAVSMAQERIAVDPYRKPALLGMRSPRLRAWLRSIAAEYRPDVIHAHSGNAHTLALGALAGRFPIVTTRRVDFAIKTNAFSQRKYTAPGQHFIAISNGVREVLMRGGVQPANIDVVFSGIDVARVQGGDGSALRREWLGDDAGPLIGFVGALVDHKAPWILAEAAPLIRREFSGARVVFVGEGEERPRLEAIRAQHPGMIVLAGQRDDIANCYAALDLFIMPSKLEGLCTSLIDALAAGVPCVASNAGGMPDVIVDGETGVLVPAQDPQALADAIVGLWRDEPKKKRFREAGTARVERHFTADAMVEGTLGVYEKLLRTS